MNYRFVHFIFKTSINIAAAVLLCVIERGVATAIPHKSFIYISVFSLILNAKILTMVNGCNTSEHCPVRYWTFGFLSTKIFTFIIRVHTVVALWFYSPKKVLALTRHAICSYIHGAWAPPGLSAEVKIKTNVATRQTQNNPVKKHANSQPHSKVWYDLVCIWTSMWRSSF